MKYYKIIFSDYSETIGKQKNKREMMKDARQYCRAWNLSETVQEIVEITEAEYSSRIR